MARAKRRTTKDTEVTAEKTETKRPRGRPRKVRTAEELAAIQYKKEHKLTLAEKQAIKLKIQKAREAAKKSKGEIEPANKSRFYCKKAELQYELEKWRDSNLEEEKERIAKGLPIDYSKRQISERFGQMLIDIGKKLLNHSAFRNYSVELKQDMLGQFFVKIIKGLKNYNFEFNNPFAFLTTAAWNSFLIIINQHYKQQNLRKDLMMKLSQELETYTGISPNTSLNKCIKSYLGNDLEID